MYCSCSDPLVFAISEDPGEGVFPEDGTPVCDEYFEEKILVLFGNNKC